MRIKLNLVKITLQVILLVFTQRTICGNHQKTIDR